MQHYTTIEQSMKLLVLGLNPETADMWWLYDYFDVRDGIPFIWGCRCFDNETEARKAYG